MSNYSIRIKSEICNLRLTAIWNYYGFDMKFDEFFDFSSGLKSNKVCHLSGGGNSSWTLDHNENSDYCELEFDISGSGCDSTLTLQANNEFILDSIGKMCIEIKLYQEHYPNKTRF